MQEFEKIKVTHSSSLVLLVENPTSLELIDKGAHGAVFRLSKDKCVKIYADTDIAKMEADAYKLAQHSNTVPRFYEGGTNYNILEYVEGISLLETLSKEKELPLHISRQLISLFREMQAIGFTRIDTSLRHVIITIYNDFKLIDLVNSYNVIESIPYRTFYDLKELSLLLKFLDHLKVIDRELFDLWHDQAYKYQKES